MRSTSQNQNHGPSFLPANKAKHPGPFMILWHGLLKCATSGEWSFMPGLILSGYEIWDFIRLIPTVLRPNTLNMLKSLTKNIFWIRDTLKSVSYTHLRAH